MKCRQNVVGMELKFQVKSFHPKFIKNESVCRTDKAPRLVFTDLSSLNHKQLKTPKIQSFRWLQFLHIFIREKFAKIGASEKMEVWLRFCNICL